MATAFAQLFWGFLFTLIDFRIQRFDILPDAVGFLLIVLGCNALRRINPRFSVSFAITIPLLVLSTLELFRVGRIDFSFVGGGDAPAEVVGGVIAASVLVGTLMFILDLVMVYHVCAGIWELASGRGLNELQREAHSRWTLYLVMAISGIAFFLTFAGVASSSGDGSSAGLLAVFFLFFVFAIVVAILFLIMLRHAQKQIPAASEAGYSSPPT